MSTTSAPTGDRPRAERARPSASFMRATAALSSASRVKICGAGCGARILRASRAWDRDHGRRDVEQPGQRDLGSGGAPCPGDVRERLTPTEPGGTARPAERGMGHDGDSSSLAKLHQAASDGAVIVRTERDLDGRDGGDTQSLVQLAAIDIRDAHALDHAVVDKSRQGTHRRQPRRAGIGRVDEVQVDLQAVQRSQARFAVGENRLGATVRYPLVSGPRHAAFGDDPRLGLRATVAERAGKQSLVVSVVKRVTPIRVGCIEHRDPRLGGRDNRRNRLVLIAVGIRRQSHAAESDSELRRVQPFSAHRDTECMA